MAEAILGALLQQLMQNINSLIQKEVHLFFGVKNDAEKLSRTLSTVLDVLEDAESRQITEKTIKNWLKMLKDAAYDASHSLDEWALEAEQPAEEAELIGKGCATQVSDSVLCCLNLKRIIFRRDMAKKFKEIINKFDEIAAQRSKFHLNPVVVETGSIFDTNRETSSTPTEPKIYGRDGDKTAIIDILLGNVTREENVSICPIVGIGGLGKTTLAQTVYNDERVTSCFDVKIWVCVSNPFDLKRVFKAVIESLNGVTPDLQNLDPIQNKVRELLTGKRYLLVLDDVWNESRDEWNKLKNSLMGGAKGSSIIVTTRLNIVASITGTIPNYYLTPLSDDDCWTLFKSRAFGDRGEENLVLVAVGKDIVKKCKGVPLAAKSLGSLLSFKPDESHWKLIRDSEMWNLEENAENEILPALRLSYKHLSPQLKRCFAYCSIFAKDYIMDKDELIRLWVANGFIQSDGGMELEDIGNVVFIELVWRSFFQDYDGTKSCKMHDLMHDLASSVMEGDCLTVEGDISTKQVTKTRHLTLICSESPPSADVNRFLKSQTSLHSLIFFRNFSLEYPPIDVSSVSNLRCLRVLSLSGMGIGTLPSSICHLKLLRYLNLSNNYITSLPESIHGLRSLQMLDLTSNKTLRTLPPSIGKLKTLQSLILVLCTELHMLPETLRNIKKLRHLHIRGCSRFEKMPVGIGELTRLETLTRFVVGRSNDSDSGRCGGISELKNLNNLRGSLVIDDLQNIRNIEEVKEAKLREKQYLTELSLVWRCTGSNSCIEVLEALSPPPNLLTFSIDGYEGIYLQEFLGTLTCLKKLTIRRCESMKCLPMMIGIQQQHLNNISSSLVELRIGNCEKLTSVSEGLRHQTSLQSLEIQDCPELELAAHDFQHLVSLQQLTIRSCKNLRRLPEGLKHLTALQSLLIEGCPGLEFAAHDLQHLVSLKILILQDLHEMTSLPEPIQHLSTLQQLSILRCTNLTRLPDCQHLISLECLELYDLPKVTSLPEPIQHLTMLHRLKIWGCENLRRLPEGLKHLTALRYLHIFDCHPELHKRCQKEKGHDWHIISHIPKLYVNGPPEEEKLSTLVESPKEEASTSAATPL